MNRLAAFFFLLALAPCIMSITTIPSGCRGESLAVTKCYAIAGNSFNINSNNTQACVACNMKSYGNLTSTSTCADVGQAVCSGYASCQDNCTALGSCSSEAKALYLCVFGSIAGSGQCPIQCNGTTSGGGNGTNGGNSSTNHTSSAAGPDRFLFGVMAAAITVPAMWMVEFINM